MDIRSNNYDLPNEINVDKFIEEARKYQSEKNYRMANFMLEYLISYKFLNLKEKILVLAIKSFIDTKTNDLVSLRRIATTVINDLNKDINSSELDTEMENQIVKILFRAATEESKIKIVYGNKNINSHVLSFSDEIDSTDNSEVNYLSSFFFWKCNIFAKRLELTENRKDTINEITSKYMQSLDEITLQVIIIF